MQMNIKNTIVSIKSVLKRKSVRYGLPFFIFMIGGSFGLREFTNLRYIFAKTKSVSRDEFEKSGIKMRPASETTIEAQYEKLKDMDIDNWEQIRGPRPWEEAPTSS